MPLFVTRCMNPFPFAVARMSPLPFRTPPHPLYTRAGHVPTFLKSFRSALERGPSAKSFRSRSFFSNHSVLIPFSPVPFCSVPFRSVMSRKTVSPFRSVLCVPYLKNGSIPLVLFLVKERFHPLRALRV